MSLQNNQVCQVTEVKKKVTVDLDWFLYEKLTIHASSSAADEFMMGIRTERRVLL